MTDNDKLVEMARGAGFILHNGTLQSLADDLTGQLAAFASAHIASLCGDVEPVAWSVTCDGEHVNNVYTSEIEANHAKRKLDRDFPDHSREVVPLAPASTVAALKARVTELEKVLERIANPIPYEQANVPEDCKLNGHALLAQLDRPEYYQAVARSALKG